MPHAERYKQPSGMKQSSHITFETVEQSICERFDLIVKMFPDETAIIDAEGSFTYREFNSRANVVAQSILAKGPVEKQIALFLSDGKQQFITIMGILKAGCAYVPIDTAWPSHRIEYTLRNSSAAAVITDNMNHGQVRALAGKAEVINIDETDFSADPGKPGIKPHPDDILHLLYTSGSTGDPKGVYTSHRNQLHFVKRFSEYIGLHPGDVFAYYFSIGFSAHAMPSLGVLLNGGTLVMYDLKKKGFPGLSDFFDMHGVTVCLMIPSVLRHFRVTLKEGYKFSKLRTLLIGGETLYYSDIRQIWPFLKKKTEIINIYASTELFLACAYRIEQDTILKQNIIPIGYPLNDIDISIVDDKGYPCKDNEIGEMVISSPYTALGYWNSPELTDKDFSTNDGVTTFNSRDLAFRHADGSFVHVGRKDAMVKIRGQRVDLGEIENTLLANAHIQEVAVALKEDPAGNKALVGYYVCSPGKEVKLEEISNSLVRRLPDYMIPRHLVNLEALPFTISGKTDYRALPEPDWDHTAGKSDVKHAGNPTEEQLIAIFEKHLETHPIGVDENILQAGYDSLKLFVAFDTIEKHFNIKLDLNSFIANPTVEALSIIIAGQVKNG
jgi:amino acid adenylation domain-containing protein